ncbi:MAG: hypothetical protein R2883_08730 [Caldisericia bacterium]
MNWLLFAFRGITARKGSWILSAVSIAFSLMLVLLLFSFYSGYKIAMESELSTLGVQVMAVPKGCPVSQLLCFFMVDISKESFQKTQYLKSQNLMVEEGWRGL